MPLSLCTKFRATRSPFRMPAMPPSTSATTSPGDTSEPSAASARVSTAGSVWRNTSSATSTPAMTPSALATISPRPRMSGGIRESVVMSPGPRSSSSARSTIAFIEDVICSIVSDMPPACAQRLEWSPPCLFRRWYTRPCNPQHEYGIALHRPSFLTPLGRGLSLRE